MIGLEYTPTVVGAAYNQTVLTTLTGNPVVSSSHGTTTSTDNATISTTQASTTTYSAASNVPEAGDFTYSSIGWGYFSNATTFVGTGATLGNSVTLALNGTAGRVLKVEFVSTSNSATKKVFNVTLAAGQQNYTFDITGFGAVALINFVSDEVGVTSYTVETKGLNYVSGLNGTVMDANLITVLPGNPVLASPTSSSANGTANGTIVQTRYNANMFGFDYTLADADDFVFTQVGWGYFNDARLCAILTDCLCLLCVLHFMFFCSQCRVANIWLVACFCRCACAYAIRVHLFALFAVLHADIHIVCDVFV
jgi:hypothetical protein